ncbi:MAG: Holliday junction resolvase RuvX [Bryobacteraceae bacterium]|nr:Holliday junction resolvase RuvX [Bryobacteraceae bacterium]
MGRILALDIGQRRIGLAIAVEGSAAHGLAALSRRSAAEDIARLKRIAEERGVQRFVVGLPLNMDGSESEMTRRVRAFAERLARETGIEVAYQDERLTSFEAEQRLRERGMSLRKMLEAKRRGAVDELAAVLILEDYLRRAGGAA